MSEGDDVDMDMKPPAEAAPELANVMNFMPSVPNQALPQSVAHPQHQESFEAVTNYASAGAIIPFMQHGTDNARPKKARRFSEVSPAQAGIAMTEVPNCTIEVATARAGHVLTEVPHHTIEVVPENTSMMVVAEYVATSASKMPKKRNDALDRAHRRSLRNTHQLPLVQNIFHDAATAATKKSGHVIQEIVVAPPLDDSLETYFDDIDDINSGFSEDITDIPTTGMGEEMIPFTISKRKKAESPERNIVRRENAITQKGKNRRVIHK